MKKLFIYILISSIYSFAYSQELIEIVTERSTNKGVNSFLDTNSYKKGYIGKINKEFFTSEKVFITLPEEGKLEYISLENTDKKWIGETEDRTSNLIIIKGENTILGLLTTLQSSYEIFTFSDEEILLVEPKGNSTNDGFCGTDYLDIVSDGKDLAFTSKTAITNEPLKILVAYTSPAASHIVNSLNTTIKDHALLLIEMTNMSYRNSSIGHRLELAVCLKLDYVGDGSIHEDLRRFRDKTDGYMDEIHSLRDTYSADVCVLMVSFNSEGANGTATTVHANESTAFCAVKIRDKATLEYVFAHEIGHLQGARHERALDAGETPYKYGHGYVSANNNWRTIMAYGTNCNECPCLQYWSNPYVIYPGDGLAMGTATYENNALVLNQTTEAMKSFRTPPANLILTGVGVKGVSYGDIQATSKMSTSGTVIVESLSELILKAPAIELNGGFSVELGTEMLIGP